tara:strand:+ start:681 stop:953 length:273 start_codon:yes stop_codon:yes gene_type:complete
MAKTIKSKVKEKIQKVIKPKVVEEAIVDNSENAIVEDLVEPIVTEAIPTLKGDQTIIGLCAPLKVDREYFVSSSIAQIMLNKGFAKLKHK